MVGGLLVRLKENNQLKEMRVKLSDPPIRKRDGKNGE